MSDRLAGSSDLIQALRAEDIAEAWRLLSIPVSVNMLDSRKTTALMVAAYRGYADMCTRLIELGADVLYVKYVDDDVSDDGYSVDDAEIRARMSGDPSTLCVIQCAMVEAKWRSCLNKANRGPELLVDAARLGLTRLCVEMIEDGVTLSPPDPQFELSLVLAEDNVRALKQWLERWNGLAWRSQDGATALHEAVSCMPSSSPAPRKCIGWLLSRGIDLHARTEAGDSALRRALMNAPREVIRQLLDAGAHVTLPDDCIEMIYSRDGVERLLMCGVSIDQVDDLGHTALYSACSFRDEALAAWLLEQGASPNVRTRSGGFPLEVAASNYGFKDSESYKSRIPIILL
ncbi:MAG: hypothetical protein IPP28_11505 [Xanthomonadales bacterium]|nr:hypothetical protein [Xanthomonadales bacterium]